LGRPLINEQLAAIQFFLSLALAGFVINNAQQLIAIIKIRAVNFTGEEISSEFQPERFLNVFRHNRLFLELVVKRF
jgi:hypothetical protein